MDKIRTKSNIKPKGVKYNKLYAGDTDLINAIKFYNKDIIEMFQYSFEGLLSEK